MLHLLLAIAVVWIVPHITVAVKVAYTVKIKHQPALNTPMFVLTVVAIIRHEGGRGGRRAFGMWMVCAED